MGFKCETTDGTLVEIQSRLGDLYTDVNGNTYTRDVASNKLTLRTSAGATGFDVATNLVGTTAPTDGATDRWVIDLNGSPSPLPPGLRGRPRTAQPKPTVITSFASGHGFFSSGPGTEADYTSDYVMGSQCLRVVTDGAGGVHYSKKNSISPTIDITGKQIRIWVKIPDLNDLANILTMTVYLGSDNVVSNYISKEFGFLGSPSQRHFIAADNDWTGITLSLGEFTTAGSPTLSAINSVWLRVSDKNGSPVTVLWGGVELIPQPSAGVVSFTFDDGIVSQYTEARKKLSQYRFPATAYIIRDLIGTSGYMSLGQLAGLQDLHGWDIASHADTVVNHNKASGFASLTAAEIDAELRGIRGWLARNGFRAANHFALPKGEHNSTVYKYVRRYFASCRTTYSLSRETFPPADYNKLRVLNVYEDTTTASIATAVTRAINNKEWLILLFHDLVSNPTASSTTQYSITKFGTIVDDIATQGISVRTISDVVENGI